MTILGRHLQRQGPAPTDAALQTAVNALVEQNRLVLEQNRKLIDVVIGVCTPKAAEVIERYELGRLQLQPAPTSAPAPDAALPNQPGVA